ncbi:MAG: histidine kinase [Propionibacteriales bacterium]|nr:histidine kinase [Propionibacteriales bacterium]
MDTSAPTDSAGSVPPDRSKVAQWGWLVAAIWLVFLVILAVRVINSDRPSWQIVLSVALMIMFATCFLAPFVAYSSAVLAETTDRPLAWAPLLVMVLIVIAQAPLVSWWVISFVPYFVAYLAFNVTTRIALPLSLAVVVALVIVVGAVGMLEEMTDMILITGVTTIANFTTVMMIKRAGQEEELQAERDRLRERDRLGRDLHDLLGHSLTVIAVKAELAEALAEASPGAAKAEVAQIRELTRDALDLVRFTVGQMRETTVSEEIAGLTVSFTGTGTDLEVTGRPARLGPRLEHVLGWIVREAGTNVLRHAGAERCRIEWSERRVRITDDGVGLPAHAESPFAVPGQRVGQAAVHLANLTADGSWSGGRGLRNMAARAAEVGARFSIGSGTHHGRGTTVEVSW